MPPTLTDVADEIATQPEALAKASSTHLAAAPRGSLFVGAGDSYAAALAAQYLSGGRVSALDPYVLAESPSYAAHRNVYFISVSGRTKSNVAAARAVKGKAAGTFSITSDAASALAKTTQKTLVLPYTYVPRMPGTLSFALSLLTTTKLSCPRFRCDFRRVFSAAKRSLGAIFSKSGTTYFLGNGPAYAICAYSTMKMFEVLGSKAMAEFLEEFGHASLFSIGARDAVNVSAAFDPAAVGTKLAAKLRLDGFDSRLIRERGRNRFESVFYSTFVSQLSVLREAMSRGLKLPRISTASERLRLSDSMIY